MLILPLWLALSYRFELRMRLYFSWILRISISLNELYKLVIQAKTVQTTMPRMKKGNIYVEDVLDEECFNQN